MELEQLYIQLIQVGADIYDVMSKITQRYSAKEFFDYVDHEKFEELHQELSSKIYIIFSSFLLRDCNELFDAIKDDAFYLDLFINLFDCYYSAVRFDYDHAKEFIKIMEKKDKFSEIESIIINDNVMEQLLTDNLDNEGNELFNDDTIIFLLEKCSDSIFEEFIKSNPRVYSLFSRLPIRPVNYPDRLLYSEEFANMFIGKNAEQFRNTIDNIMMKSSSYQMYIRTKQIEESIITDNINYYQKGEDEEWMMKIYKRNITDFIIDYLFEDKFNNVKMNIPEVIRYNSIYHLIPEDHIMFYQTILSFADLSVDQQLEVFQHYRDSAIFTQFYEDIHLLKEHMYNHLNEIIVSGDNVKNDINEEFSKKCGVDIIDYRDKPFYMLVRRGEFVSHINKKRSCYSLISNENTSTINYSSTLYGYSSVDPKLIVHCFEEDSYSSDCDVNESYGCSRYVNRIMTAEELVSSSTMYSEINILNNKDDNGTITPRNPDYIVAVDLINDTDIEAAKRFNVPIILINNRVPEKYIISDMGSRARKTNATDAYKYR